MFTKNRVRLIEHDVGKQLLACVVLEARAAGLMSSEHFTVDGTLIEAWASLKSFRRKDEHPGDRPPPDDPGNPSIDFHGEKRRNDTQDLQSSGAAAWTRTLGETGPDSTGSEAPNSSADTNTAMCPFRCYLEAFSRFQQSLPKGADLVSIVSFALPAGIAWCRKAVHHLGKIRWLSERGRIGFDVPGRA